MWDIETCKAILNKDENLYSDKEVEIIRDLLLQWAQLSVEAFTNHTIIQTDETGRHHGKGKL